MQLKQFARGTDDWQAVSRATAGSGATKVQSPTGEESVGRDPHDCRGSGVWSERENWCPHSHISVLDMNESRPEGKVVGDGNHPMIVA